jgi:hypothetical protein
MLRVLATHTERTGPCVQMAYAPAADALVLVMADGSVALSLTAAGGLLAIGDFEITHWLCESSTRAVCAALGVQSHVVAVGCADGVTRLYSLSTGCATNTFELSLCDWGHDPAVTGAFYGLSYGHAACWCLLYMFARPLPSLPALRVIKYCCQERQERCHRPCHSTGYLRLCWRLHVGHCFAWTHY